MPEAAEAVSIDLESVQHQIHDNICGALNYVEDNDLYEIPGAEERMVQIAVLAKILKNALADLCETA